MNGISPARSSADAWRMIASYAGGGASDSRSVVDNLMLRFRPIAPKPATCPDGAFDANNGSKSSAFSSKGRRKRKYVRFRRNRGYARNKKADSSDQADRLTKPRNGTVLDGAVEEKRETRLLQLLPDRSTDNLSRPIELDLAGKAAVTVECVTVTATAKSTVEDSRNDPTARDWVTNMERDTCPGFVSDGSDSVTWVNGAFRRMVAGKEEEDDDDGVGVELVIKERFPSFCSAFAGHVKLKYYYKASGTGNRKLYSRVVPCDLWRIDGGGFAWRLDVDSALSLGLAQR